MVSNVLIVRLWAILQAKSNEGLYLKQTLWKSAKCLQEVHLRCWKLDELWIWTALVSPDFTGMNLLSLEVWKFEEVPTFGFSPLHIDGAILR